MTETHSTDAAATPKPVILVAGPTASGKSACAVALARAFDGVIINADSMQIYDQLRVVTARPSADEEAQAPHRLYGVLSPLQACSTGMWLDRAAAEIRAAWAAGKRPIVCGGTGLYLKVLMEGIAPIPDVPDAVREQARALHAAIGGEKFREKLAMVDAEAAARLPAGDSQRLIRAYEIATATGRTQSDWQNEPAVKAVLARYAVISFEPDRGVLYPAIDARFLHMMAAGALDEVRAFAAQDPDPALPACKAVGVRELMTYLQGDIRLDEAVQAAQQASRNYAKRQLTWLRTQLSQGASATHRVPAQYSERLEAEIFSFVRQFLLT